MLHKSFKSAKCKTALNLGKSRVKLLKNKKETQVKQLRRELAHLLESGQDQTARIRVEHVVREEKTMGAYELIELYCELIVARLPIIESQKNCPLDLKEAITSLIFAAPRCGDIPELQDVRKHFTAKYGKEFAAAAVELHPACGVSRIMVEKLSVKAPDGPTKVKILTAIAEEHNIKWEPKWFKDEVELPSADFPQKVQHTEKVNVIQMAPLKFEIPDDPPERHVNDASRSAASSQSPARADNIDASAAPQYASSRTDTRLGSSSERVTSRQSSRIPENVFSTAGQNWSMEFTDATTAAQAAAESAERASLAARAAAELSARARIINDTSSRPMTSSMHGRSEGSGAYADSVLKQEFVERNPSNNSFKMKEGAEVRTYKEEYTHSVVQDRTGEEDFRENKTSSYPVQDMGRQSRDSLFVPSTSRVESNVFEFSNKEDDGNEPVENPFHEETVEMKNKPNIFHSQSSTFGDEYSIFSQVNNRNKNDLDDGSFRNFNQGTANYDDWHLKDAYHSGSYDVNDATIFRDQGERATFLGSHEHKHVFESSEDIFRSKDGRTSEMDAEQMGTRPTTGVVFDDSDSDDDEYIIDHVQKSHDLPLPDKSSPKSSPFHKESSPENQGNQIFFSRLPSYGLGVSESFRESPIYSKLTEPVSIAFDSDGENSGSEKELQSDKTIPVIPSRKPNLVSEFQHETQSNPEVGRELNLGPLPGGLRNRPYRSPPYTRGVLGDYSSSPRSSVTAVNDAFDASPQTKITHKSKVSFDEMENQQIPKEKTSDDPEMVTTEKNSFINERPYSMSIYEDVHKTSPKSSTWYFDSDGSDSEDTPKQSVTSKTIPSSARSRRTKDSARRSVARSQPSVADDVPEASPKLQTETTGFRSRYTDPSRLHEETTSFPSPQRVVSKSKEKESLASFVEKETANSLKGSEIPSASSSNEKAISRENSAKNPSHVHPKLPDFEIFTAHLQSLRTNRE